MNKYILYQLLPNKNAGLDFSLEFFTGVINNDFSHETSDWYHSESVSQHMKFMNQKVFLTISKYIMKGMFLFTILSLFLAGTSKPDNLPLPTLIPHWSYTVRSA